MKPATLKSLLCLATVALSMPAASAQAPELALEDNSNYLGETYTGLEYGYIRAKDRVPRVLHRYGFVSSKPLQPNVDAAFRYNFTSGSAAGVRVRQHDFAMSFTGYLPHGLVTPYLQGDLGWAWTRAAAVRDSSVAWLVGAGAELQLNRHFSLTPYINYREIKYTSNGTLHFGARVGHRLNRDWSARFTVESDDDNTMEFGLGVHRRF